MFTGIKIHDDCMQVFNDFKIGHKYSYVLFTISNDERFIVVDKKGPKGKTYEDLINDLPQRDICFAVYDYDFHDEEGNLRNRLIFISWVPNNAPARRKMISASTRVTFKNALPGVGLGIQANDYSEIQESELLARCIASVK
ncbi:putative actin depolymerizing factor [Histomonas meleagridis]|uniref:putative actin depolymerizing factor n=1 Tax=Histomonas meleagridis TaxID=135588 RepID=UPI00355A4C17|nr:putative actin depolymerizing factor [Histomonas meleagridis]KAH0796764.1 putative actin depolymerizing factor [Histomonas meleagridis]